MGILKSAGLILLCGLHIHSVAASDSETCLKNYAQADSELAHRVVELETKQTAPQLVLVGGGTAGWMFCSVKSKSAFGVGACSVIFGAMALVGYSYSDQIADQIQKIQDSATIMRIYAAIKDNRNNSDEVTGLMQDLGVDLHDESIVAERVVSFMESGDLCNDKGLPNKSYAQFQELLKESGKSSLSSLF